MKAYAILLAALMESAALERVEIQVSRSMYEGPFLRRTNLAASTCASEVCNAVMMSDPRR